MRFWILTPNYGLRVPWTHPSTGNQRKISVLSKSPYFCGAYLSAYQSMRIYRATPRVGWKSNIQLEELGLSNLFCIVFEGYFTALPNQPSFDFYLSKPCSKLLHNYWKSAFLGTVTHLSKAIFHSHVSLPEARSATVRQLWQQTKGNLEKPLIHDQAIFPTKLVAIFQHSSRIGGVHIPTYPNKHSMAMQQEPIDWRYLPYIRPIFQA